jgi:hypothetical protein
MNPKLLRTSIANKRSRVLLRHPIVEERSCGARVLVPACVQVTRIDNPLIECHDLVSQRLRTSWPDLKLDTVEYRIWYNFYRWIIERLFMIGVNYMCWDE